MRGGATYQERPQEVKRPATTSVLPFALDKASAPGISYRLRPCTPRRSNPTITNPRNPRALCPVRHPAEETRRKERRRTHANAEAVAVVGPLDPRPDPGPGTHWAGSHGDGGRRGEAGRVVEQGILPRRRRRHAENPKRLQRQ